MSILIICIVIFVLHMARLKIFAFLNVAIQFIQNVQIILLFVEYAFEVNSFFHTFSLEVHFQ